MITVMVVYALPERAVLRAVQLPEGATAAQAVAASGLIEEFPELAASIAPGRPSLLGIFSRRVGADHPLAEGDRLELYRPLEIDPKEIRRRRAAGPRGG